MKRLIKYLFALVLLVSVSACAKAQPTWQEQYDLGIRYLSEGNYKEAIIAFTAVIEIDPKQAPAYVGRANAYIGLGETEENLSAAQADYEQAIKLEETNADAYLGLADVYIRQGDYVKALETLKDALTKTGNNQSIADKIQEIENGSATDSSGNLRWKRNEVEKGSEAYEDLEFFLNNIFYGGLSEYDFRNVNTKIDDAKGYKRNILEAILYDPLYYAGPVNGKDFWDSESDWNQSDPQGKWFAYASKSCEDVDWVLEQIFNCSASDIASLKETLIEHKDDEMTPYILDGRYYNGMFGVGGGFQEAVITDIIPYVNYYFVTYEMRPSEGEEAWGNTISGPFFAVVERKTINDREYWSVYYHCSLEDGRTLSLPTGEISFQDKRVWKRAYMSYLQDNLSSELADAEFQLIYIDDNDIPELWICYPTTASGGLVCTFDGENVQEVYISEYGTLSYIERSGYFYSSGGHMDVYWDGVFQLKDGRFTEVAHGDFGAEDNTNVQFGENGPIYQYVWNGQSVSETEYQQELKDSFDLASAHNILDEPIISFSELQQSLID